MHWTYRDREVKQKGYTVTEMVNRLIILGQRGSADWLYWDTEAKQNGYAGTERVSRLVYLKVLFFINKTC